jgi:two-component system sensor histidine kinase ChvG
MVAETDPDERLRADAGAGALERARAAWAGAVSLIARYSARNLTTRIIIVNVVGLLILTAGILYLNQFRTGLITARVESMLTQAEIIAAAIAGSATIDTNAISIDPDRILDLRRGEEIAPTREEFDALEFPINPERVTPFLQRIVSQTRLRARIYDRDSALIVDSDNLSGHVDVLMFGLEPPSPPPEPFYRRWWSAVHDWLFSRGLPRQPRVKVDNAGDFPEIAEALAGHFVRAVRVNKKNEIIVSVAVPIQRLNTTLGALILSTEAGVIDAIVRAERWAIIRVFLVALFVTVLMSVLLAGTIANPMRRLADAADRVRRGVQNRVQIPDFTERQDEIGHLSGALRDMTEALYNRIESIEQFAADVAHEIKNPLTSLRSAVETLPLVKDEDARRRLIAISQDDIHRLDRLISDISDASRLDAELARGLAGPVDMAVLLETVVTLFNEVCNGDEVPVTLDIDLPPQARPGQHAYMVHGHDMRLGQVFRNLVDNARSFSPKNSKVRVAARRIGREIEVVVDDDGPGIPSENLSKVFARFYTDRPGEECFGKNSGLGLSISKQIVEAHEGRIWAENRYAPRPVAAGAERCVMGTRLVVRLPAMPLAKARP